MKQQLDALLYNGNNKGLMASHNHGKQNDTARAAALYPDATSTQ